MTKSLPSNPKDAKLNFQRNIRIVWMLTTLVVSGIAADAQSKKEYELLRKSLVETDIIGAGIKNPRVIESILKTLQIGRAHV